MINERNNKKGGRESTFKIRRSVVLVPESHVQSQPPCDLPIVLEECRPFIRSLIAVFLLRRDVVLPLALGDIFRGLDPIADVAAADGTGQQVEQVPGVACICGIEQPGNACGICARLLGNRACSDVTAASRQPREVIGQEVVAVRSCDARLAADT